ncbi:MAG: glycosyltransferase family 2 protein, partial [Gemmatimonadaceae bacterium]|nr:glycosyltransferase family 2 protein [Gemmatimonadaceae bacterium]
MLRICIPVHNEATTIGVLLWRLRSVFQGFSREYDVVVYDDASTDGTGEVLEPYQSVMPLTVLRGGAHRGYAASIDALVRHVAADDEYARRDAMVLLQGDFTESPEHLPELVKRFEGGADLVAVHRTLSDATPQDERRLRRWGRWAVKPFLRLPPVADPFTGFRLVRISVLRELLKALGTRPVCAGEGWAANIDFALNVTPFARRIENVEFAPRYDVRQRASRRRGWPDVMALFHWARSARSTVRPSPGSKPVAESSGRTPSESALVSP